jgi:hypothetical protein
MKYSKYFHIALETVAPPNESWTKIQF